MDLFNVGRIMKYNYCNALLDGAMMLISPLLDGSCFKMLALDNNLKNEKSFHGSLVGNSKRSLGFFLHLTLRGHFLMCHHLCVNLRGHST
jgi:hypothetical protein